MILGKFTMQSPNLCVSRCSQGHHIWPPRQQAGLVPPSQRATAWRCACTASGFHLWRCVGLWRKIHILSAGPANGWRAERSGRLPWLLHLSKGQEKTQLSWWQSVALKISGAYVKREWLEYEQHFWESSCGPLGRQIRNVIINVTVVSELTAGFIWSPGERFRDGPRHCWLLGLGPREWTEVQLWQSKKLWNVL